MNEFLHIRCRCVDTANVYFIDESSLKFSTDLYEGYRLDSHGRHIPVILWDLEEDNLNRAESLHYSLLKVSHPNFCPPSKLVTFPCRKELLADENAYATVKRKVFKGGHCFVYEGNRKSLRDWLSQNNIKERSCLNLLKSLVRGIFELENSEGFKVSALIDEVFMCKDTPLFIINDIQNSPLKRYFGVIKVLSKMRERGLVKRNMKRVESFVDSMANLEKGVSDDIFPWHHSLLLSPDDEYELFTKFHTFNPQVAIELPPYHWVEALEKQYRIDHSVKFEKFRTHVVYGRKEYEKLKVLERAGKLPKNKDPRSVLYTSTPTNFLKLVRHALAHPKEVAGDQITLDNMEECFLLVDKIYPLFSNHLLKSCCRKNLWEKD